MTRDSPTESDAPRLIVIGRSTTPNVVRKRCLKAAITSVLSLLLRTLVIEAFRVSSASMSATLAVGDRVLVNKLVYRLRMVKRGEIVVVKSPFTTSERATKHIIKRIVALPGEVVEAKAGRIYVNGVLLHEPYLPEDMASPGFGLQVVPLNHVWVLGDNRLMSTDSRTFGSIPTADLVGRAFARTWPVRSVRLL